MRIVRTPDGIVVEEDQRLAGRGAYLHADPACWDKAMNVKLGKALRIELTAEDLERLQSSMKMLPKPDMAMKTKVEELIS